MRIIFNVSLSILIKNHMHATATLYGLPIKRNRSFQKRKKEEEKQKKLFISPTKSMRKYITIEPTTQLSHMN